ncbi:MAG: hypothetical protein QXY36_01215 [Sulfolobales archaeon]
MREVELTSSTSRSLALANNLVNGIESLIEDCSCSDAYILNKFTSLYDLIDEYVEIGLSDCAYTPDNLFELNDLVTNGLVRDVRVRTNTLDSGVNYRVLYELALNTVLDNVIPYMRNVSLKTAVTEVEYMYIILRDGRALLLEGDFNKVVIPNVNATLTVHTHSLTCLPSRSDLKSISDLFVQGGLGSGITSPTCYFAIFRVGYFTEEEYAMLRNLYEYKPTYELPSRKYLGNNILILLG